MNTAYRFIAWLMIPFISLILVTMLVPQPTGMDDNSFELYELTSKKIKKLAKGSEKTTPPRIIEKPEPFLDQDQNLNYLIITLSPQLFMEHIQPRFSNNRKRKWHQFEYQLSWDRKPRRGKLKLHGWTTLDYPAKSYSIQLKEKVQIAENLRLNRFFILNLAHDKGFFHNRFCTNLLAEIDLFPNSNKYISCFVNKKKPRLYLLVERTQDALLRFNPEISFVARRRTNDGFEIKYSKQPSAQQKQSQVIPRLLHRYIVADTIKDPDRKRKEYQNIVNMDQYMTWLAFNSLVKYPDSLDELFFYKKQNSSRLHISAWDYDQLYLPPARPDQSLATPLLHSVECTLGKFIANDKELQTRYRILLYNLLTKRLTQQKILKTLHNIKIEIHQTTKYWPEKSKRKVTDQLTTNMEQFKKKILHRREELLTNLLPQ